MDFSNILELYKCKACVMSLETYPDGKFGNIRIAAGNKAHAEDIEHVTGHPFENDTPYELSFPKDLNFEDFVYRSAVQHQQLHSYVNLYQMGLWLEIYMLPLTSDKENVHYCLYSYNVTAQVDSKSMSDLSPETSSAILSACIKLHGAKDFKESMHEVIRDIREICDARRCCILLIDDENQDCFVLSDAIRPGVAKPKGESMRKNFYYTAQTWESTLAGSTCLIIKNEQDMEIIKERNPVWYASLSRAQVDTLVLFPLKHNSKLVGYIWASNFDVKSSVKIKEVLELTTFFIGSEIANYQLLQRLEMLSTIDLLTGAKNRNAMNNRVAEFDAADRVMPATLGIIFADLNGLKQTNDTNGHVAGDRLLKKAAAMLHQVFLDEDIYRAGGDEFMIISENCLKSDMEAKIAELRKLCGEDGDISFAIGFCFDDKEKLDIRKDMHLADEDMYEDKEEYYNKYPARRYR